MLKEEYAVKFYQDAQSFYAAAPKHPVAQGIQSPFQFENWQSFIYEEYVSKKFPGDYIGAILFKGDAAVMGGNFLSKKTGNVRGLMFLSAFGGQSDYNDFIYFSNCVKKEEISFFVSEVLKRADQSLFRIDRVKQSSPTVAWANGIGLQPEAETVCANINICSDYEEYWSGLSKSTRQNIRTAKNRAAKDGIDYKIVCFDEQRIDKKTAQKLIKIYEARKKTKNARHSPKDILLEVIRKVRNRKYHLIFNAMTRADNVFSAYITFNGEISGYFFGLKDLNGCAVIMQVAFDDKMKKYSPGMILLSDCLETYFKQKTLKNFDLATGDEQYKFNLGAKEHYSNSYIYYA